MPHVFRWKENLHTNDRFTSFTSASPPLSPYQQMAYWFFSFFPSLFLFPVRIFLTYRPSSTDRLTGQDRRAFLSLCSWRAGLAAHTLVPGYQDRQREFEF